MSKLRKRLDRIRNNPKDVKWDLFRSIIEYHDLIVETPNGGSHFLVYHPEDKDDTMIVVPVHSNRVKPLYVKRVLSLIEDLEELE